MGWFARWRRARILKRAGFDESIWRKTMGRYSFTRTLADSERARLRELVILFLHEKGIYGAGGMVVRDEMRISIAAQACILILNLDLDCYRGWFEVIVYPDQFVAEYEYMDDSGVMHQVREPMTGESWLRGPVILSWKDAGAADRGVGYNVVIHEFAHKLDMLNGDANGFPPLHAGMSREAWSRAFGAAYADFCRRVGRGEETLVDPYAADDPAEFFAVTSEAFFEIPQALQASYPEVYRQLAKFYRQDPLLRLRHAAGGAVSRFSGQTGAGG
ncbi:MAG TPA: M90 family metallopeptidase [Burkholderiales bacterium]|nr:M90 family metallopeptidase [Burkholderiales bacterium]